MKTLFSRIVPALALLAALVLPAAAAETYVLSLNLPVAPIHNRWTKALKPLFDEMTKRSEGRLVIEPYFAQALSKQEGVMDSLRTGIADLGEANFGGTATGKFPFYENLLNLISPDKSFEDAHGLILEMAAAFPEEAARDSAGVKVLFTEACNWGMVIGTHNKPVRTLDDLKGLKIALGGSATRSDRLRALGVTPVSLPGADHYMAVEKGLVDGIVTDFDQLISRRFGDVIKYMTMLNVGTTSFYCAMNQNTYDRLPADLRAVIDDVCAEMAPGVMEAFWADMPKQSLKQWKEKYGGEVILLSDEDYAKAAELTREAGIAEWLTFLKDKGLPGEAMLTKYREIEDKFTAPWKTSKLFN